MKSNTKFAAEHLARDAKVAEARAAETKFLAEREALLAGSYEVGTDEYSSEFFTLATRPKATLTFDPRDSWDCPVIAGKRSLHRLPNGDWLEIISGGAAWTRHTYDVAYALDRARRAAIGGYVLRADLAEVIEQIVASGANRASLYAEWQGFRAAAPHVPSYSRERTLRADERRVRWVHCITEDMLPRHPQHQALLVRAVELLGEPDVLREYPAPLDVQLSHLTRDLEAALAAAE